MPITAAAVLPSICGRMRSRDTVGLATPSSTSIFAGIRGLAPYGEFAVAPPTASVTKRDFEPIADLARSIWH